MIKSDCPEDLFVIVNFKIFLLGMLIEIESAIVKDPNHMSATDQLRHFEDIKCDTERYDWRINLGIIWGILSTMDNNPWCYMHL